jgi:hypothetical protein
MVRNEIVKYLHNHTSSKSVVNSIDWNEVKHLNCSMLLCDMSRGSRKLGISANV